MDNQFFAKLGEISQAVNSEDQDLAHHLTNIMAGVASAILLTREVVLTVADSVDGVASNVSDAGDRLASIRIDITAMGEAVSNMADRVRDIANDVSRVTSPRGIQIDTRD